MVGPHGLAEGPGVGADGEVVLPYLPVLKVAAQGFPEGVESFFPDGGGGDRAKQGKGWRTGENRDGNSQRSSANGCCWWWCGCLA